MTFWTQLPRGRTSRSATARLPPAALSYLHRIADGSRHFPGVPDRTWALTNRWGCCRRSSKKRPQQPLKIERIKGA